MVTVFPSNGSSVVSGCGDCSSVTDRCIGCSETGSKRILDLYTPVINPATPEGLTILKTQLKEVLAMVEAREKVVLDSLRPKTAAEIEMLQTHLAAAMEDLKRAAAHSARGTAGGAREAV